MIFSFKTVQVVANGNLIPSVIAKCSRLHSASLLPTTYLRYRRYPPILLAVDNVLKTHKSVNCFTGCQGTRCLRARAVKTKKNISPLSDLKKPSKRFIKPDRKKTNVE